MLRSNGKQSGKSVESVLEKKRKGCGGKDLWKRKVFSLEWKSVEWVVSRSKKCQSYMNRWVRIWETGIRLPKRSRELIWETRWSIVKRTNWTDWTALRAVRELIHCERSFIGIYMFRTARPRFINKSSNSRLDHNTRFFGEVCACYFYLLT